MEINFYQLHSYVLVQVKFLQGKITHQLPKSVKQGFNNHPLGQQIPKLWWKPNINNCVQKSPLYFLFWATLIQSSTGSYSISLSSIFILHSNLRLRLRSSLFHRIFWPKFFIYLFYVCCMKHWGKYKLYLLATFFSELE